MRLVMHIVLKDARRHWPEIVGYCLATAAWGWREAHPDLWWRQRELLPLLMFGLWFLITIRVVQGESLVGDREWWPTRPYRWGQLLTAKSLLLATALNGPLVVVELLLLLHADIPLSSTLVPGMFLLQAMFVLLFTFPVAVLATVTSSIVQWVMTVVGIVLATVVCTWLPWGNLPATLAGQEDVGSRAAVVVLVPAMVWVLLWQYARRRERRARIVLAGALATIPLFVVLASTRLARHIAYPQANSGDLTLEIKPAENGVREFGWSDGNQIRIPVVDPVLKSEDGVRIEGYRLHLVGSDWRWDSEWRNSAHHLAFFDSEFEVEEGLPPNIYKLVKAGHVEAQIEVAWESYRFNEAVRVQASAGSFTVPGIGHCRMDQSGRAEELISARTDCSAPLTLPPVYLIALDAEGNTCKSANGEPEVPAGYTAYEMEFGSSTFNPNPVRTFTMQAGNWVPKLPSKPGEYEYRSAWVCPGGSFTVRTGRLLGRRRASFDLGDIEATRG